MGKLIIAEKPSVAGSIAAALGATKRQDGYFEGNGYYVSNARGHYYTLADTEEYNPDMAGEWNLEHYPFIPDKFMYKPIDDPKVKKQIKIIKELASKADVIINACDGDREGELIFAELKNNLHFNKPVRRLWITSHTPQDVLEGMKNLKESLVNLESAGYCRQQIDWIIGINLTVVYTVKTGGETLKLGRVVLPTLKLIFDREIAIANYKSTPFYTLKSKFKTNDEEYYTGTYYDSEGNSRILDKSKILEIQESIKDKPGSIIKREGKKTSENAPKLFNLTDLQGHITNKYPEFSSDDVLRVLQGLYEKKYVTYPRTASRYLDNTLVEKAKESLYAIIDIPELNIIKTEVKFHTESRVFDSSKVDSHPAIIPTYIVPDFESINYNEKIIYTEIAKRFIAQFMPAAIYDTLEVITKVDEHEFITRGRVLTKSGWKQLYNIKDEESEENDQDEDKESISATNINLGDNVLASDTELKEGKTKPPAHYTEKTLLTAMENCGKNVENEDEILKGYTIGTPATRGDTIKKLFECKYVSKKGKNILITDLGLQVIHYFPVKRLLKTDFTGQIEKTLKDIENGQYDSKAFMEKMIAYVIKNIEEIKSSNIPSIKRQVNVIGKCPKCGKNVVETEKAFSCEGTRSKQCNYTLWKENKFFITFGKKLTESIARDIVNKGKATVSGMKNPKKEGETFKATISVEEDPETKFWNYKFENNKGKGSKGPKKPIKFKRNN